MNIRCASPVYLLPLIALLFTAFNLQADEPEAENVRHKTCVFLNVDLSSSEDNRKYQGIITNLLTVELKNAGFIIVPRESLKEAQNKKGFSNKDLILGPNAVSLAKELEADLAVTGFYRVEDKLLLLEIKCYDVAGERLITGILKTGRLNLSICNLITSTVSEMIPEIQFMGQDLKEKVQAEPLVQELTLLSTDEDMAVYLAGDRFIGLISQGVLILPPLPVKIGSELDVEKRKEGYHTGREVLHLEQERQEIKLKPLSKKTRLATEVSWTSGQFMGLGFGQRCYLNPDYFFISAEHYFYIQHNLREGSRPVFHHDFKFLAAHYLFLSPESRFRFGVSSGLGLILTYYSSKEMPLNTDFYFNVVNIWFEWGIGKWIIFIREEGKYSLGIGKNLLGRNWLMVGDRFPPVTIGLVRKW